MRLQEFEHNVAGDRVRNVPDHAQALALAGAKPSKLRLQKVAAQDADLVLPGKTLLQFVGQVRVQLDCHQSLAPARQVPRQRASPGADFNHHVPARIQSQRVHKPRHDGRVDQKMLTQTSARPRGHADGWLFSSSPNRRTAFSVVRRNTSSSGTPLTSAIFRAVRRT